MNFVEKTHVRSTVKPFYPDRFWLAGAALMAALAPFTLAALLIDTRLLDGANVWAKPLKFQVSFAVHFATLAVVSARLSEAWRRGWLLSVLVPLSLISLFVEIGYMMLQAARQEASHFNVSTSLHAFMYYGVMATGAVLIVAAAAGVGWAAWRDREAALGPATRLGVVVGLIGGSVLTLIFAGFMSQNLSHQFGSPADPSMALPITGWSTETGDLRTSHFFATHAMQVLPLFGMLLDRLWPQSSTRRFVVFASAIWFALSVAIFVQALAGRPFLAL
ncbi:MAG: hypothetical protein EXQ98_06510 [Alphaproteobacteria bacterium]|nr:hypothetical protein [Alphaproteobacteria bacterium]